MRNTNEKFQEFYEKYKNRVAGLAFDMTKDFHLAQDICQETFLKLYKYWEHVDEKRVKSWLLVVAANLVRDYYRKGGKYQEFLPGTESLIDEAEVIDSIDAYLERQDIKDLENRMMQGLRKRNPDWYEVFVLVEYMDVPRKIVARNQGIALSTVDSYLKKSKKWMETNYREEYENL